MNSRKIQHACALRHDPYRADMTQAFGGVLALLEIAVVSSIVVGFFDAVSQPFGWPSAAQFLLCACLAVLLWLADARRESDSSFAGNSLAASARHESALREMSRREPVRQES